MRHLRPLVFMLLKTALTTAGQSYKTRTLAGISVPDTPTITRALAYARSNMDDQTYNHVMRSWLVGQASISHLPSNVTANVDLEAFAVSAILHDLGWSKNPDIISLDKRFEVDGADAARYFLLREGQGTWGEHRIQLVWDAIALHTSRDIALYKQSEVWMTSIGILSELVGPNVTLPMFGPERVAVKQDEWDRISKEFPRTGLRQFFRDVMIGLCTSKPSTAYNNFMADYGEAYVEGYTEVGKRVIDFLEANMLE
ncbi:hypothetical protein FOPG_18088 [Fusarium oxysporum f. sp. conglutinans race 2 54008]|uniref:HD domain-containing protein n=2 Tax=Fusarium oxysporum f. sp. conglutinans TaxID=100902 RepID=F9G0E4_FUSOF|nr:hypothetical protein FOXB_12126 [Fusarium oxysporum f. sp. conglutinans Fo5176]EXL65692.1 hypothetical protein FOPG_18088 [Fusarium oxysporum f. sp. conglutinans race 2 54008]KAG7003276.1 hypothetical protein FocnCong_v001134 [Fusarium oxysporum f. sp. conglutinans]KAI8395924.1 hypothetical protein FOFC_21454 [Fusarium oxysporum]